jgi:hypothetical protein
MANTVYNVAKKVDGSLDVDTDTVKMLLISGTTAPDPDHTTVSAVLAAAAELSATGYSPGASSTDRKTLTVTVTVDNANNRVDHTTNSQTWSALNSGTLRQVLIYKHTGTNDASNVPIMCIDTASGLPLTLNGSDVTVGAQTYRIA